jgi:SAM-dependent methyltransferase
MFNIAGEIMGSTHQMWFSRSRSCGVLCVSGKLQWLGATIGGILLISFLVVFVESLYMIWSSKVGKFHEVEKMLDLIHLRGDEAVLDVGCERGLVLTAAARRLSVGKAFGIDIWNKQDQSGNDQKVTKENAEKEGVAERVEVISGDMRALPFPDGYFDVVVSSLAIHNIHHRGERNKAISEVMRLLKPGGQIAILDFQYVW